MSPQSGRPSSGGLNKVDGSNLSIAFFFDRSRQGEARSLVPGGDPANRCFGDQQFPGKAPSRSPSLSIEPFVELHVTYLRRAKGEVNVFVQRGSLDSGRPPFHALCMSRRKPIANAPNSIAFWREVRGWTIEQLEERSTVSSATISRLETGKNRYSQDSVEKLANALRVPVGILLTPPGQNPKEMFRALLAVLDASPEDLKRLNALLQALDAVA